MAFDLSTGRINWVKRLGILDVWTAACDPNLGGNDDGPPNCDIVLGGDYDFCIAPTFIPGSSYTPYGLDILVAAQKSGFIYALDAETGDLLWQNNVTPGSEMGGFMWGIASDDAFVYYTAVNFAQKEYDLQLTSNKNDTVRISSSSAFGALSLIDGSIKWQRPTPPNTTSRVPPTVVNDLVITGISGSQSEPQLITPTSTGTAMILDKESGRIVAQYPQDSILYSGFVPVGDYLLFGTGYSTSPSG